MDLNVVPGLWNEHVSAVIIARPPLGSSWEEHDPHIYHNPFAISPLPFDLFRGYRQYVKYSEDANGIEMKWQETDESNLKEAN